MSVSNYTNWGNWAFVLLWINARLRPVGEGLRSGPSPSPLLRMRYHNMTQLLMTVKLNKKPKHLTPVNRAALPQLSEPGRKSAKPAQGQAHTWRWDADLKQNYNQLHSKLFVASAVQPLSSNCFTSFNECWQMPKKWSCTGRKSIVLVPSRFF